MCVSVWPRKSDFHRRQKPESEREKSKNQMNYKNRVQAICQMLLDNELNQSKEGQMIHI